MISNADKRKHPRIPPELEKRRNLRVPVENVTVEVFSADGQTSHPEICSILNISETGMLFEGQGDYKQGQSLRLTFMLPETIVIIRTIGTVAHTYEERELQYVGVDCERMSTFDRTCIRQFIQKNQK